MPWQLGAIGALLLSATLLTSPGIQGFFVGPSPEVMSMEYSTRHFTSIPSVPMRFCSIVWTRVHYVEGNEFGLLYCIVLF